MAKFLTAVDDLTRPDHSYLDSADACYFHGEYTARHSYAHSATNQLISNLKKSPLKRGLPEYRYKVQAIAEAATILRRGINAEAFANITFIPVPPSRAKGDPEYDDRMVKVTRAICEGNLGETRELVIQRENCEASHLSEHRPRPQDLVALYEIQENLCAGVRELIVVVDDMLTTGCHFAAMKSVLLARFPDANVIGLFVARRVPEHAPPTPLGFGGAD